MPIKTGYFSSLIFYIIFSASAFAQHYTRADTIEVKANGNWLKMPWAGGHNYSQFSDIDMNFDGIKDLLVFDRSGNKITTYINNGIPNTVDYKHAPQYEKEFPHIENWVLLVDYNCDGKEDIFTCSINQSGIRVYKNISSSPANLQFTVVKPLLTIGANFIPANSIGLPAITDMDNDGDLDILTFSPGSWTMDYYINKSKELGYNCDSLIFNLSPGCWGHFTESGPSCSAILGSCRTINRDSSSLISSHKLNGNQEKSLHNGSSCSLCLDMDGDNDKELLIGQGGCCNMTFLTNGGTSSSANMTALTSDFPSALIPVNLKSNPCGYFLDVNNDSKRDLLISPSSQNVSLNNESIWYYQNMGADDAPVFTRQTRSFLQEDMIDVGEGADPVFFDFDSDGLTDLLVSNYVMTHDSCPSSFSYGIFAYKNIGALSSPKYELISTDFANLSSALPNTTNKHLTFGDLDGDSDTDMMIGDYNGLLHYFENSGGVGNPCNFILTTQNYPDNTGIPIDVGSHSTPQLIDVDRDNDLDLILGERAGNLNYYENTGTPTSPSFTFISNNFGGVHVMTPCCTGYSVPFMYDSAGNYSLLVGSEASRTSGNLMGWLWHYKNIDGNLTGNFTLVDSTYNDIWEGIRMTVFGKDINNDNAMDLVVGNYLGGVVIYMGDTSMVSVSETSLTPINFSIYPNPSTGEINILIPDFIPNDKIEINICNSLGESVVKLPLNSSHTKIEKSIASGIYSCELRYTGLGEYRKKYLKNVKKLIILK